MAYYNTCPECGAHLDSGEKCNCEKLSEQLRKKYEQLTTATKDGQIIFGGNYENYKN